MHIRISPKFASRDIFAVWSCRFCPAAPVVCISEVFIEQTSIASYFSIAAAR